jgi:dienelactone hydrolase
MATSTNTVDYPSGGQSIRATLCDPGGPGPRALVLIAHGSDGLVDTPLGAWRSMILGYVEAVAQQGFLAMIPEYFAGSGPLFPEPSFLIQGRPGWLSTLKDALSYA